MTDLFYKPNQSGEGYYFTKLLTVVPDCCPCQQALRLSSSPSANLHIKIEINFLISSTFDMKQSTKETAISCSHIEVEISELNSSRQSIRRVRTDEGLPLC